MEGILTIRPEGRVYFLYQGKPFDPSIMQVHTSTRTSARCSMSKRESWWVVKHGMIKGGANSKQDTQSQWISTLGFTQDTHSSAHRVVVLDITLACGGINGFSRWIRPRRVLFVCAIHENNAPASFSESKKNFLSYYDFT